jgi:hypothetical protein
VRWVAFVVILAPGAGILAGLITLTSRVMEHPAVLHAPRGLFPYLPQALITIDAAAALGLLVVAAVLARMPSE